MASIMETYGARGTSGRGALVAVFDSETAALSAASVAQSAQAASGQGTGAGVRMAVVAGDTLLDVYRRPVGGPALAVACAVRALAGANQILATAQTVAAAPDTPSSPLGQMPLDASSVPVDLVAIRWAGASAKGPEEASPMPLAAVAAPTPPPLPSGAGPGAPSA
jgi:class 3 adenylate cyclase